MLSQNVELIGSDLKFVKAKEFASNIAVTKVPALIVGESGTGKKTLCRYIHQNSARKDSEFLIVDCALEAQQVENEILGYRDEESGRFKKGALELGNSGTVVLANIDGLEENFQKRLFKIFQELTDYEIDVRILASTTKNLSKYVGSGRFYRALYTFFMNNQIVLTPLRERGHDIEIIANRILASEHVEGEMDLTITEEALEKIKSYYWAHNISELESVMKTAVQNATEGQIDLNAIELGERKADNQAMDFDEDGIRLMSLKEAEKLLIKKALVHTSENRTQAAKILGVSIRTLRNKINEYRNNGSSYFVNLR